MKQEKPKKIRIKNYGDCSKYEGETMNEKEVDKVCLYSNGDKYVGECKDNRSHGIYLQMENVMMENQGKEQI